LAKKAGDLSWDHIRAEYTQDSYKIAATLASNTPVAWTLARPAEEAGGAYRFLTGTTFEEVRGQYEVLRTQLEIHGWEPLLEIRTGWYTLSQGISKLRIPATGQFTKGETVVMFPVGKDGILGELQIATVGRPDGRAPVDEDRLPLRRMAALAEHDAFMDALRGEDVGKLVAAHIPDAAVAVRNYLTDQSSLLNVAGAKALEEYYTQLFAKYRVLDIQLVNRIAETWYVFAELHWTVEERGGARRTLEFCTGDVAALDPERKYWVKTGAGTDPVEVVK
jgi:hypothetical protein